MYIVSKLKNTIKYRAGAGGAKGARGAGGAGGLCVMFYLFLRGSGGKIFLPQLPCPNDGCAPAAAPARGPAD